ncbi:MAG: 4-(cytidine 5'-diphospho)-2-C-methyl-D-erythritol kinase [Clostridia bacterium]|nr:4-(cytidine 5'-diphospho)-2-C-methyl-D-erythritol kinase [Clostridia bacterium]
MDIIKAYAKINLFLEITGKRSDNYHEISTVMNAVSVFDAIEIEKTDGGIEILCDSPDVPDGEGNIVYKAVKLLLDESNENGGVRCIIHKNSPTGAGLGGGSSDAGSVLRYLNTRIKNPLSYEKLNNLAARVGADVPYFLSDGVALAKGIGEKLTYGKSLSGIPCLLIMGGEKVSSAAAYGKIDALNSKMRENKLWSCIESGKRSLDDLAPLCFNRFEDVSPYCKPTLEALMINGAKVARLSGSGSCSYGLFGSLTERDRAYEKLGGIKCITI